VEHALDTPYVKPDVYEAMVECATSVWHNVQDAEPGYGYTSTTSPIRTHS
jgi:hypothetical protein